ncbi:MAG TPA: CheR family methyltransferase [Myxococcales bacterium]|nr:CheR family methyltransferase [Myxococcales bacterium]
MIDPGLEDQLVERLAAFAAAQIGFSAQAVRPEGIRKVLREELRKGNGSLDDLVHKLQAQDDQLLAALRGAIVVGETYFFRQSEHFDLLVSTALPALAREVGGPVRAWSAGCSTGEEAYSLAACFLAARPKVEVEVWGTDVSAASLQVARGGFYTSWSSRQSSPPLYPVVRPLGHDRLQVLDDVAALARFVEHNLLEAARPTLGEFHVIFCRNVLAYFSPPAARIATGHLVDALAPGGYAFFGTMDVSGAPPGLEEMATRGLQVFRRPRPQAPRARPPPESPEPVVPTPGPRAPFHKALSDRSTVELHVRALQQIERGHRAQAEQDLWELRRRAPSYLPGLLELSLLHLRNGRRGPAEELMREILHRAEGLKDDEPCLGPELLPVSYYRTAARALLSGPGSGSGPASPGGQP